MDSSQYYWILDSTLIPFIEEYHARGAVFQQDHAHNVYERTQNSGLSIWMSRYKIVQLVVQNLNPIENICALIAQKVYKNGRQFDCIHDLKELKKACIEIQENVLYNFVLSGVGFCVPSTVHVRA